MIYRIFIRIRWPETLTEGDFRSWWRTWNGWCARLKR